MEKEMLEFILPKELLRSFQITKVEEKVEVKTNSKYLEIEIEEINQVPLGYNQDDYESKGFYPTRLIQDFPIRGKAVYLAIKRRRWRNKKDKSEIISNDYSFIAEGTKITKELSDFLKDTGRKQS
jgi:hypothetical protein